MQRYDPPRDVNWKSLSMRVDVAGKYVLHADAQAEIARLTAALEAAVAQERDANEQWRKVAAELTAERDAARAETAMAFEAAAGIKSFLYEGFVLRDTIRALTPTHATAALAARDKATREQALLEAAHVAQSFGPMDRDEILAIINKDT